jgi:MFS family permease
LGSVKDLTAKRYAGGFSLNVIIVGVVSFLTDASSEMIVPILPLFLTETLLAPLFVVGLLEGLAESTASILKAVSGFWSDRVRRRRPFMLGGYSISAVSKLLFAFSTLWQHVVALKFAERVGKGIRAAPKDALLADSCTPETRGKVYGFHKAMDTAGAAVGVVIAFALVALLALGYETIFLLSAIPATAGVLLLFFIKERGRPGKVQSCAERRPFFHGFDKFSIELKVFMFAMAVLSITSVLTSFLILLARLEGATPAVAILCYLAFNVVYFMMSMHAGSLSDRVGRYPVILSGYVVLLVMFVVAYAADSIAMVFVAFLMYGLTYALTQGAQKALVADLAPSELCGSAMGVYNMSIGLAALPMALVGGALATVYGVPVIFAFGGCVASVGIAALVWLAARRKCSRLAQA